MYAGEQTTLRETRIMAIPDKAAGLLVQTLDIESTRRLNHEICEKFVDDSPVGTKTPLLDALIYICISPATANSQADNAPLFFTTNQEKYYA